MNDRLFATTEIVESLNRADGGGTGIDRDLSFLKGMRVVKFGFNEQNDENPDGIVVDYEDAGAIKRAVICHDRQFGFYVAWKGISGQRNANDILIGEIVTKIKDNWDELSKPGVVIVGDALALLYRFEREDGSAIMCFGALDLKLMGKGIASSFFASEVKTSEVIEKLWNWAFLR